MDTKEELMFECEQCRLHFMSTSYYIFRHNRSNEDYGEFSRRCKKDDCDGRAFAIEKQLDKNVARSGVPRMEDRNFVPQVVPPDLDTSDDDT